MALDFAQALDLHAQGRSEPGGFSEDAGSVYTRLTETYGMEPAAAHWLAFERRRVELNALPSDRIISLIEGALGGRKKLVPTDATLARAYRQAIAEAAARKARSSALDQSGTAVDPCNLRHRISGLLEADPALSWDEALMTLCMAQT